MHPSHDVKTAHKCVTYHNSSEPFPLTKRSRDFGTQGPAQRSLE